MTDKSVLSGREKEILELVAEGLTNREIAQRLSISHNTVKVHLSNIFEKIGVSSRTEATVYAIEHRIVDVPGGETTLVSSVDDGFNRLTVQSFWVLGGMLLLIAVLGVLIGSGLFTRTPSNETISIDQSERWQELAPLPEPRVGMAAVAYSGEIYVIGGEGPEGVSGKGFRYVPETDEWLPIAEKPTPVTDISAVVIGEKIYVPGGEGTDGRPIDTMEIYDPRKDRWEVGAPLPEALSAYALADFEGRMYLFGGWDGGNYSNDVWIYNPTDNAWGIGQPMEDGLACLGATTLTDNIVVLGGWNEKGVTSKGKLFYPSRDLNNEKQWEAFNELPQGRYQFGIASTIDSIYVVGGFLSNTKSNSVVNSAYIFFDKKWKSLSTVKNFNNRSITMLTVNSNLYILDYESQNIGTSLWVLRTLFFDIYIPFIP
ncbi:MAG: LuxR C-terminal-related transcriptional regulator [Chloroflexota bacterium]|nr:LuxR C-terminal-related transcriptional regulator [Chloroflexota bacterium]